VPPPTELSDRDYRALARFRYPLRVFQRFSERAAREAGLTPSQHQLLLAIRGGAGTEAPRHRRSATSPSSCGSSTTRRSSWGVDRAVAGGLVERNPDPVDRRRQRLALTAEGEQMLAHLTASNRAELRRLRSELADVLHALESE
jgi:hypothetical protein